VAENITSDGSLTSRLGWIDLAERDRLARGALEQLDTPLDLGLPVYELSVAQQQVVEIAKAISKEAELIIMDEPTAALSDHEVQRLFGVISSLKSKGITIIYVSHRMEEIFSIADRVT
jgi:ribose transport system ATP-binding protein